MTRFHPITLALVAATLLGGLAYALAREAPPMTGSRSDAQKAYNDRNYKDAYETFRRLALDSETKEPTQVGNDLNSAVACLQQLNRTSEIDEFRETVIDAQAKNWRALLAAAQSYVNVDHHGFMIAGEFQRGRHRGGGQVVNATQRDRVRAMQLMVDALPMALEDDNRWDVAEFLVQFANILLNNRGYGEAWRLQYLTDLETLPDYDQGWGHGGGPTAAPVDADGNPIYHHVPKTFDASETDGQRWRWCLETAIEIAPTRKNDIRRNFAEFLQNQFGVQTMAHFGIPFGRMAVDDTQENESGTYALHTLAENETIARLATGVKRFTLPDEFNFVKIWQEIAADPKAHYSELACQQLAQTFENRRQYPTAAKYWRRCLEIPSRDNARPKERLDQIVNNWGRFESAGTQPAGKGATIDFRFRNGDEVNFTAKEIDVPRLLDDVKAHIKARPKQLDHNQINIGNIGYRLVHENQQKYARKEVASWTTKLEPRDGHFDRRITVTTPMTTPGAYLVTAKMDDGNTSHVVLWVADTAIVKKPLDKKVYLYVGDAVSGQPIPKANVELFGYRIERRRDRSTNLLIKQFAEYSDENGQVILGEKDMPNNYQWLIVARGKPNRFAFLGYTHAWFGRHHDNQYHQNRVFTITDRPVYRPGQKVHYKFWLRHAQYDKADTSDFAGQTVAIEIHNAKNERVVNKSVKLDEYGGVEGELDLPKDASLGVWRLNIHRHGGGTFRVEEYKKPEYEVTVDAPAEPVMLGEKIEAEIAAKYYFGSPVTNAKVKYKITRTAVDKPWYPPRPWDWFYGPGYWWFGYDYTWYPGFVKWGCMRPTPFWWPQRHAPPEIVAEREVEIGPDGKLKVEIDTLPAKELHPDQDHQYTVTAEVIDQSRRTIVGSGNVLVARKPFKVYAWVDRGYYRVGDTIGASFSARTLDSRPVEGAGEVQLLKIRYKDGKPVETAVHTAPLSTNAQGMADLQLKAAAPGQYRLSYKLTDKKEHTIEGGYVFTVRGERSESSDYRFNNIELIPDKAEYKPGEKVRLMINTDRPGGTVLLFTRPSNGIYLPPEIVRLEGKSTFHEIAVAQKDMPNFFVEAVTMADGRVHSETKEIVVPPEKRVVDVEVLPSESEYLPGQKATVELKLTDFDGKPFHGSTVVAVYDKSVEYISGGSNVPEIREFFWKWRRHHNENTETSLNRYSANIVPKNKPGMNNIGVFGATVADDLEGMRENKTDSFAVGAMGGMGGGMAYGARASRSFAMKSKGAPVPSAAPMAMAEMAMDAAEEPMGAPAGGEGAAAAVQPTVRSQFADTALWVGALSTKKDGTAQVSLTMPENLTTWRIKCWAMGHGTRVGQGVTDVVTRKNLVLRMQAPRFFVEKDEVVLSANVHNYLETKKSVQVKLELDGNVLKPLGDLEQTVEIEAEGEARVDWRVKVAAEGEAVIRMLALTDEESDAMEMRFPAYVHGMLKMEAVSGAIRPDENGDAFTIRVPAERRPEQTRFELRYSPTLAGAMVDALPYLAEYPYGCTEQTLNRFLPTVITQKILLDMGLNLEDIKNKQANLNAQEIGDDRQRAEQWKHYDRNPVFDEAEVRRMVKDGVNRLTEMQLSGGGWGWFSGYGEYPLAHTTAVVVHGLQIAQQNDVALVPGVLERGVEWLKRHQIEQVQRLNNALKDPKKKPWKNHADNLDALVYMVLVDAGVNSDQMRDFLYRDRPQLAVYSLATFGLALHKQGEQEKLEMIMRNIEQYLEQDDENQTAWLNLPGGRWWYWYGSEYEAHAYYLKLLSKTDPKGRVASRLVKYLLNNRKHATYWNSTRDTALCIEAMAEFMRASGEAKPEMTVEVWLDGELQKAVEITSANLFQFDNKLVVEGADLADGPHKIELKKKGTGPLYYNAYLTNFTLEDPIKAAGLEIKVGRKYYRLNRVEKSIKVVGSRGQAADQRVEKYEREPLADLSLLKSGELVEIELEIASKNDYEYVIFEDMKAAGFEPVDLRSGYTGNAMGAYVEFRDNRVVFFVNRLARGNHSVAYRMRAEIPGKFSALPTKAWAMYAPELKANSDEIKLRIED
jgi:alpha-2-macroglobulin